MEVLKPCPFCGSGAMMFGGGSSRQGKLLAHVECASRLCLARTGEAPDAERAAEIWNKRAEHTNHDATLDRP